MKIFPKKIILLSDGTIKAGNYTLGHWEKERTFVSQNGKRLSEEKQVVYLAKMIDCPINGTVRLMGVRGNVFMVSSIMC